MTDHTKEDIEALIEALKDAREYVSSESCMERIDKTLAKFAPKPAKVYVLPEWGERSAALTQWCIDVVCYKDEWNNLRELTATDAPAQKWNMPTLQQIKEICGQSYGTTPTNLLDTWYEALRNKIMAMND